MKLFYPDPPSPPPGAFPTCQCFNLWGPTHGPVMPVLHAGAQDTACDAWRQVVEHIEAAIRDGVRELAPLDGLSGPDRARVVTLPDTIERLVDVRALHVYGSHLVRIPPQIGGMRSLAYLDVYTSHRLHFLPYEVTRCSSLRDSRVSTRALYGNFKHRPPFPDLLDTANAPAFVGAGPRACSVCASPLDGGRAIRCWITLAVGTDRLPLLVHACSSACIDALPRPPDDYVPTPHTGGRRVVQPPPR